MLSRFESGIHPEDYPSPEAAAYASERDAALKSNFFIRWMLIPASLFYAVYTLVILQIPFRGILKLQTLSQAQEWLGAFRPLEFFLSFFIVFCDLGGIFYFLYLRSAITRWRCRKISSGSRAASSEKAQIRILIFRHLLTTFFLTLSSISFSRLFVAFRFPQAVSLPLMLLFSAASLLFTLGSWILLTKKLNR